jgi:hypothetical protein
MGAVAEGYPAMKINTFGIVCGILAALCIGKREGA